MKEYHIYFYTISKNWLPPRIDVMAKNDREAIRKAWKELYISFDLMCAKKCFAYSYVGGNPHTKKAYIVDIGKRGGLFKLHRWKYGEKSF